MSERQFERGDRVQANWGALGTVVGPDHRLERFTKEPRAIVIWDTWIGEYKGERFVYSSTAEKFLRPSNSQQPKWEDRDNARRRAYQWHGLDARGPVRNEDGSIDWYSTDYWKPYHDALAVL